MGNWTYKRNPHPLHFLLLWLLKIRNSLFLWCFSTGFASFGVGRHSCSASGSGSFTSTLRSSFSNSTSGWATCAATFATDVASSR